MLVPAKKEINVPEIIRNKRGKETYYLFHRFRLHMKSPEVRSVSVSPDNRYLIISFTGNEGLIRVLDLEKLEFLPHKYFGHTDSVRLTSITNDSKSFYTASWDGSSRKFNISTGECNQILSGFGRAPSCFIDSKQKYLFTASYDSDVSLMTSNSGRCWDLISEKVIHIYKHKNTRKISECIDIAYDDHLVYTASDDGCAFAWELIGGEPHIKYFEFNGTIRKIAISENYFIAGCTDGFCRSFDKLTGKHHRDFFHSQDEVRDVRISKDQTRLFCCSADGSVKCFNIETGETIFHRKIHLNAIWSICLMNQDKILISGSIDGVVSFNSANTGQIIAQLINIRTDNDILITCPPDNLFPSTGFFYTKNTDFIEVVLTDKTTGNQEILNSNNLKRAEYLSQHNLKNLIITRLKNNNHYNLLTDNYLKNQKILHDGEGKKLPLALKAFQSKSAYENYSTDQMLQT